VRSWEDPLAARGQAQASRVRPVPQERDPAQRDDGGALAPRLHAVQGLPREPAPGGTLTLRRLVVLVVLALFAGNVELETSWAKPAKHRKLRKKRKRAKPAGKPTREPATSGSAASDPAEPPPPAPDSGPDAATAPPAPAPAPAPA